MWILTTRLMTKQCCSIKTFWYWFIAVNLCKFENLWNRSQTLEVSVENKQDWNEVAESRYYENSEELINEISFSIRSIKEYDCNPIPQQPSHISKNKANHDCYESPFLLPKVLVNFLVQQFNRFNCYCDKPYKQHHFENRTKYWVDYVFLPV